MITAAEARKLKEESKKQTELEFQHQIGMGEIKWEHHSVQTMPTNTGFNAIVAQYTKSSTSTQIIRMPYTSSTRLGGQVDEIHASRNRSRVP